MNTPSLALTIRNAWLAAFPRPAPSENISPASAPVADLTRELAQTRTALTAARADLSRARADAASAETARLAAVESLELLARQTGLKPNEIGGKSPDELRVAYQTRVEFGAMGKLAELGFPSAGLPPCRGGSLESNEKTRAEFQALSPIDRLNFCKSGGIITDGPDVGGKSYQNKL